MVLRRAQSAHPQYTMCTGHVYDVHACAVWTATPRTARQVAGLAFTLDTQRQTWLHATTREDNGPPSGGPLPPHSVGPGGPTVHEKPYQSMGGRQAPSRIGLTRRILTLVMTPRMTFGTRDIEGWRHRKRPCKTCAKNSNFLVARPLVPSPQIFMGTTTIHADIVRPGVFWSASAPRV